MNLPTPAKTYYSKDTRDACFSARKHTDTPWPCTSLYLPTHEAHSLTSSLEHALYSAHHHRQHIPCSTILFLPTWQRTPYQTRNLHTSYAQKLTSIPFYLPSELTRNKSYNINIYLVANQKYLSTLNPQRISEQLEITITEIYGTLNEKITININRPDPTTLDSCKAYQDTIPPPLPPYPPPPLPPTYHTHNRRWTPESYIYTDGSQTAGNPILGAAVVSPAQDLKVHIRVNSHTERHTINRGELAAITVALQKYNTTPTLQILTDSSFCINCLRNFALDPSKYRSHLHEPHLRLNDMLLRDRERLGYPLT